MNIINRSYQYHRYIIVRYELYKQRNLNRGSRSLTIFKRVRSVDVNHELFWIERWVIRFTCENRALCRKIRAEMRITC